MTTANESHAAAGTAATSARVEDKAQWWKNPIALHIAVATVVIIVALIINATFQFNFFWKLLTGSALVWGGAKMTKAKVGPVNLWGKVLQGLGWAMIVLALLNSGVRAVAEKSITWIDHELNSMAGTNGDDKITSAFTQPAKVHVVVNMKAVQVGEDAPLIKMAPYGIAAVNIGLPPPNGSNYWACPTVISPSLSKPVKFETVAGAYTTVNHVGLTEESKKDLLSYGGIVLTVKFTKKQGVPGKLPCDNLK